MNNDERARLYVDGVKEANKQDNPTWEMLETAFVAGMNEQKMINDLLIEQIIHESAEIAERDYQKLLSPVGKPCGDGFYGLIEKGEKQ